VPEELVANVLGFLCVLDPSGRNTKVFRNILVEKGV